MLEPGLRDLDPLKGCKISADQRAEEAWPRVRYFQPQEMDPQIHEYFSPTQPGKPPAPVAIHCLPSPKWRCLNLQFLWHSRFSSFFTASHLLLPKLRPQAHAPFLHILWQRISNESCKSARHKLLSHQSRRMLLFASSSTVITCVCALSLWRGLDGLRSFHSHHWWLVQVQTSAVLEEMMKLHSWVGCFWLAPKSKQECE